MEQRNVANARRIAASVAAALPARTCACRDALTNAIVTPLDLVPDETKRNLAPILARYLQAAR